MHGLRTFVLPLLKIGRARKQTYSRFNLPSFLGTTSLGNAARHQESARGFAASWSERGQRRSTYTGTPPFTAASNACCISAVLVPGTVTSGRNTRAPSAILLLEAHVTVIETGE